MGQPRCFWRGLSDASLDETCLGQPKMAFPLKPAKRELPSRNLQLDWWPPRAGEAGSKGLGRTLVFSESIPKSADHELAGDVSVCLSIYRGSANPALAGLVHPQFYRLTWTGTVWWDQGPKTGGQFAWPGRQLSR